MRTVHRIVVVKWLPRTMRRTCAIRSPGRFSTKRDNNKRQIIILQYAYVQRSWLVQINLSISRMADSGWRSSLIRRCLATITVIRCFILIRIGRFPVAMESKREEFRKYLEKGGALQALNYGEYRILKALDIQKVYYCDFLYRILWSLSICTVSISWSASRCGNNGRIINLWSKNIVDAVSYWYLRFRKTPICFMYFCYLCGSF